MIPMHQISIIIPFLNEEDTLPKLCDGLRDFILSNQGLRFEVILVDDGSTDQSAFILKDLTFPCSTKVISLSRNFGSHAALRAGMVHARGDFACFLYADLQDPVENILVMHQEAVRGNDIVWGIRRSVSTGLFERIFSRAYARLMQRFVSPGYPDKGFDTVMVSRKVLEVMNQNIESNSSVFLQLLTLGFRQGSVTYDKRSRIAGASKWTLGKKVKLLIDSFVAFSFAPIRFVTIAGMIIFLTGLIWTVYILSRKILYNDLAEGWPMLTSILFLGFGLTNISLGIIAEYLWRTLDSSRKRPVFVIDSIEELKSRKL